MDRNIGYKLADYAIAIDNDKSLSLLWTSCKNSMLMLKTLFLTIACDIGILTADKFTGEMHPIIGALNLKLHILKSVVRKCFFFTSRFSLSLFSVVL